ncbi:MAG: hypothetical protein IPH78_11730 [Bacteroidetes bacterium]|nr:hypothetical protein [Bacteroidota bacterium]
MSILPLPSLPEEREVRSYVYFINTFPFWVALDSSLSLLHTMDCVLSSWISVRLLSVLISLMVWPCMLLMVIVALVSVGRSTSYVPVAVDFDAFVLQVSNATWQFYGFKHNAVAAFCMSVDR